MGRRRSRGGSNSETVYLRPESKKCAACDGALRFDWNNDRHVRFVGGPKHIDYHVYSCRNAACPLHRVARKPEALSANVLDGYEVSLEVIALIGYYRLKIGMSYPKIRTVASLGIPIAGVATDGEPVVVEAVETALPGVPCQLCQFHFLRNFGKGATKLDAELSHAVSVDLKGLNRFEAAASLRPSNRATEVSSSSPRASEDTAPRAR